MAAFLTVLLSCSFLLTSQGAGNQGWNHPLEEMVDSMIADKMIEVKEEMESRNFKLRIEMEEKVKKLKNENGQLRMEIVKKDGETKEMVEILKICLRKAEQNNTEMKNEIMEMKKEMKSQNAELITQMKDVEQKSLRTQPIVVACAYQNNWTTPSATITYQRLSADFNNADCPGGGDGRMDITSGKFTAVTPGHYTVSFSGHAFMNPGEDVIFYLMHNDKVAGESSEAWWDSGSSISNAGYLNDQGSRSLVSE